MARPPRQNIAAPPFPPGSTWIGAFQPVMERLTAEGPVLVHFFDFAQLNAVRTLPYLRGWHERYSPMGLTVIGAHTPRFPLSGTPAAVSDAVERLGIPYPVLTDERYALWADYGCQGWPSLFLWSQGGVLRWYHFGEGEYRASEDAIRSELDGNPLPEPMEPLRPGDAPGATVIAPTPELLPGGSEQEPWRAGSGQAELDVPYEAGGAFASLDGKGTLELELDGEPLVPIAVEHPGLYELVPEGPHAEHQLRLRPDPGVLVYSVSFAAGVPA